MPARSGRVGIKLPSTASNGYYNDDKNGIIPLLLDETSFTVYKRRLFIFRRLHFDIAPYLLDSGCTCLL